MGAPRWQPTESDLTVIRRNNTTDAARILGRAKGTIHRVRSELGITTTTVTRQKSAPIPEPEDVDADEEPARIPEFAQPIWHIPPETRFESGMWHALEGVQREMSALDTERDEVAVELPDDRPVLVAFSSDWHLGHCSCLMSKLRTDLETIRNTPGLYVVLGGDLMDNVVTSVTSRGMSHEQLTPVRVQKELIHEAVAYLGAEKVLAMVLGNHENWSLSSDDFDPIAYFAKRLNAPYLGAFGYITVTLGGVVYRILAAHQFRMRSSFNKTHQGKRLNDFHGDADLIFTGHTHDSAVESTHIRQRQTFIGQAGTYLRSSRYSKQLGFTASTPEMPGAILFPRRKKAIGIYDALVDGPRMLAAFRSAP